MKGVAFPTCAALAVALAIPSRAWAQEPGCEVFTPDDFRGVVVASHDALLSGDVAQHRALLATLQARVPCLDASIPPSDWARFLYELAMVRYADGQPWQDVVTAALLADPGFSRTYGPTEVRTFTPPVAALAVTRPDVRDASLWIDGSPAPARFDLVGPHILQTQRGAVWSSVWVEDGALPQSWLPAPVEVAEPAPVVLPEPVVLAPPEPASPPQPVAAPGDPSVAVRVVVDVGLALAHGAPIASGDLLEPATRLWLPVELGVEVDAKRGWFRVLGTVMPLLTGEHVFTVADDVRTSRVGGGASVSGGARFGIGQVGALVGARLPSRVVAQALGGVQLHRSGLGVEVRAGLDVTTVGAVEPAFDLLFVFAPRVWSTR